MAADELVVSMREMISVADLCYPNYTEACYLTGMEYNEDGVSRKEAKGAHRRTTVDRNKIGSHNVY